MPIPDTIITIKDNALGVVPPNTNSLMALLGVCSSGTLNTVYQFNDIQTLKDTLGTGPLVEAAAHVLSIAGGPVVCIKTNGSVAGTVGSVTLVGTGLSVLTTTGSVPLDGYSVAIKITTGATNPAAGLATFRTSLDGGLTYSGDIALPTSGVYAIPATGVTINLSAASLVAGDVYSFTTVAPGYSVSDFNTTWDALMADNSDPFCVHVVGIPADGTAAAALAAALDSKLTTAQNTQYRFLMGLMQAQSASDSSISTGLAAFTSTRVAIAAGFEKLTSQITGAQVTRPASFVIAARAAKVSPAEDLGRVASGNTPGITSLLRDEFKTPGLDAKAFSTLRTHIGLPGFYVTNGRMFSSPTSDYQYFQHRRVMDIACKGMRLIGLHYLNDSVRVNSTTGLILEVDALKIEAYGEAILRAMVTQPGYASDVGLTVDRTVNMLSTNSLVLHGRVIPLGYAKYIYADIGFLNPALLPV